MKNKLTMNRLSKYHFFNGWASSQLSDIYKKSDFLPNECIIYHMNKKISDYILSYLT